MRRSLFICSLSILFFLVCTNLYSQINVKSPISGQWANKQMLIIDTSSGGDYFYSVDGSDPENFGFAYDGPVLLDVDGNVTLKIAKIISTNKKETLEISYSVIQDDGKLKSYSQFISSFFDTSILNYTSGTDFSIPSELKFSFEFFPKNFINGKTISISEKSVLTRTFPCTILDSSTNEKWRFFVKTYPSVSGTFSRRDLPIKIVDWETIEFLDENLIYKIDGEFWSLPKNPVKLDRNQSHMISWQSINYEFGNPIESFVLPPKPQIKITQSEDGEIICTLDGDESYKMSLLGENFLYQELFSEICADVFFGENVSGTMQIGIFCSGLFQGEIDVPYSINKSPSSAPKIISDTKNFYTRKDVNLKIQNDDSNAELYYAISEPFAISDFSSRLNPNSLELQNVLADDFVKAESSSVSISLKALKESSVFYKVRAFSKKDSNQSPISEYSVIIDQNYYYDSSSSSSLQEGTLEQPFTDFNSLLQALNSTRNSKIFVLGDLVIPSRKYEISSNCIIIGEDDSNIIFDKNAQLIIKDSSLDLRKISIKNTKDDELSTMLPLIKGQRSVLSFTDCLIYAEFEKTGSVIDSSNCVVYIENSICAILANSYSCFMTGVNSKIFIEKSNITANSETSVLISFSQSQISCKENTLSVNCKKGRIAEFFESEGVFEKNVFKGELSKSTSINPIFTDEKCSINFLDNETYGF